jgi:hypothetical protein
MYYQYLIYDSNLSRHIASHTRNGSSAAYKGAGWKEKEEGPIGAGFNGTCVQMWF